MKYCSPVIVTNLHGKVDILGRSAPSVVEQNLKLHQNLSYLVVASHNRPAIFFLRKYTNVNVNWPFSPGTTKTCDVKIKKEGWLLNLWCLWSNFIRIVCRNAELKMLTFNKWSACFWNASIGSCIFLKSCLAHIILPEMGGMSRGTDGSSRKRWYSFLIFSISRPKFFKMTSYFSCISFWGKHDKAIFHFT